MALSTLDDASSEPSDSEVLGVVGDSAQLWTDLVSRISRNHAPVEEQWHFGGAKFGWNLRLVRKKRVILYLTPQADTFLAGLVLGEAAVRAVPVADLPEHIAVLVDEAPRYAEGRGVRIPVRSTEDVRAVEILAAAKMSAGGRRGQS